MKRVTTLLTALLVLFATSSSHAAVTVLVNEIPLNADVPAQIIDNRTFVPLSAVSHTLNAAVRWEDETKTVTVVKDKTVLSLKIGDPFAVRDGKKVPMDAPARIIKGRTMVPIAFIASHLDIPVQYNAYSKTVLIGHTKPIIEMDPALLEPVIVEPDIVFISHHQNFAWSYQSRGTFIDKDGKRYYFDLSSYPKDLSKEQMLEEIRNIREATVSEEQPFNKQQLKYMCALIQKIDSNKPFDQTHEQADFGNIITYALRYVKDGSIEFVKIDSIGDWREIPQDPYAKKLMDFYGYYSSR